MSDNPLEGVLVIKKILICSLLAACITTASAVTWSDLLAPKLEDSINLCGEVVKLETQPRVTAKEQAVYSAAIKKLLAPYELYDVNGKVLPMFKQAETLKDGLIVQLPTGAIIQVCREARSVGRAVGVIGIDSRVAVYIGAKESKTNLDVPMATLSMLDLKGQVLKTLQATSRSKKKYSPSPPCPRQPCSWSGIYLYGFMINDGLRPIFEKTATLKLSFNRGNGVESRTFTISDFGRMH